MLPYSAEAFFALVSDYNLAMRPLPALALFFAAGVLALAVRSQQNRGKLICAILAAGWAWTGLVWHMFYFADLNFAAPIYGAFFVLQALLLLWIGVWRRKIEIGFDGSAVRWIGIIVMGIAVVILPLIDWTNGMSWTETRFALITPGTTAALTAGVLLLSSDRARYWLMTMPVLWLLATAAHAWILDVPQDYILAASGVIAIAVSVAFRSRFSN